MSRLSLVAAVAMTCLGLHVAAQSPASAGAALTISVVGTNDVHGYVLPAGGRGGLPWFGGYLRNLRAARARDARPGGVLLLDAGDTFQGGIESNLSEGGLVVDGYNALGFAAAAIGNHEFDFGPLDRFDPADGPDARGALKAIAARARYPMLAANLLDAATGEPVAWPNVTPSAMTTVAGVRIGLIGAMTVDGLRATLGANVHGLQLAPLAPAVRRQADRLRTQGAELVVLTIHAGGSCSQVIDQTDLTTCDGSAEIVRLLEDLPHGTLDAVVAGHIHATLAHVIKGVPVIESLWGGRAFGRIDLALDAVSHRVISASVHPPQHLCIAAECAQALGTPWSSVPVYEGVPVTVDTTIERAMAPELARVRAMQATPMPVIADTLLRRGVDADASLGNLFADAMRESFPGVDIAVNNNGFAGLRADLPAGPLTFGRLYDVFPFDNRLVQLRLTGAQLERVFLEEIKRDRPGALSVSGVRVETTCEGREPRVRVLRLDGHPVAADATLTVITTDMLAAGAVFASVAPESGVIIPPTAPIARVVVEGWLRRRGGHLSAAQFQDVEGGRWSRPADSCDVH